MNKKGMTLIEMLVVVGIMAVVAGAFGSLVSYQMNALQRMENA